MDDGSQIANDVMMPRLSLALPDVDCGKLDPCMSFHSE
jgi:hypothetical protein